VADVI